jgi:YHS domain-containing protein
MSSLHLLKVAPLLLAATMFGCGDKHDEETPATDGAGQHGDHEHGDHEHGGEGASDVDNALKALSTEDQKLARAQKTCPVSEEELGSMGTPIKVSGGGETVFLCCEGCRKRFERNPQKYLAKMKK